VAFIPRHMAPAEMKDWANWVQKRDAEREARDVEQDRKIALLLSLMNSGAKQTALINRRAQAVSYGGGLPAGGIEKQVLGKLNDTDYAAGWVENTVGGMFQSYYDVEADGSDTDLLNEFEGRLFEFNITSAAANSPYGILLPDLFNFERDLQMPFYFLSINVFGDSVDLSLTGDIPHYLDHPTTYLLGMTVVTDTGTVTLPDGFSGQWFIIPNHSGSNAIAIPLKDSFHTGTLGQSVSASATPPTLTATAAAGTGPTVSIDGTSVAGEAQLITGTSPTTTGWGELLTFTDGSWVSGDVPIVQLRPANQAAAGLTHYVARSGVDAEVHVDLTGIAASTTYLFSYQILPFAA